jgi:hypothetical protein
MLFVLSLAVLGGLSAVLTRSQSPQGGSPAI